MRLLLEAPDGEQPLPLERILAITFTKAATRDMRLRIRSAIQSALRALQKGENLLPYLQRHAQSQEAQRRLETALAQFDKAQIFTIHGFCQKMLSEFSLEARILHPVKESSPIRKAALPYLLDFLEQQEALCPEQLAKVLSKKRGVSSLCDALLAASCPAESGCFAQDLEAFCSAMEGFAREMLPEEFERIKSQYKISGFKMSDLEAEVAAFSQVSLHKVLGSKNTLFDFLDPGNAKKSAKEFTSALFDDLRARVAPLLKKAAHPPTLFERLRFAWQPHFAALIEEKGLFSPDLLLERMERALEGEAFCKAVQGKYDAAIIDEFQDTDRIQWHLFETLFVSNNKRCLYLVGDPKQSIYRFRNADLYTYFDASRRLGKEAHHSLDTNHRSTPALIAALNDLFGEENCRPWLLLPRDNSEVPYRPVRAGKELRFEIGDDLGAVHFFAEELFFVEEILRLRPHVQGFGSFAILVKDRHEALRVQNALQSRSIPCWTKSQTPLGESMAAIALQELFEAICSPRDKSRVKIWLAGPLMAQESLLGEEEIFLPELHDWKALLEEEGFPAFFREFLSAKVDGEISFYERIRQRGSSFFRDFFQIAEQLLEIRFFSLEAIRLFFCELQLAKPDDEQIARRRIENDEEAVHIITMHASKGLEFDVVFALGVASPTPASDDEEREIEAEKLRQLYVAFTRAKLRLYIPLPQKKQRSGKESPLDQFFLRSKLGDDPLAIVERLAAANSQITFERKESAPVQEYIPQESLLKPPPPLPRLAFERRAIHSFTSLAKGEEREALPKIAEGISLHTLPRGAETGVLLHTLFERIFSEHKDPLLICRETLRVSLIKEWAGVIEELVQKLLEVELVAGLTLAAVLRGKKRTEIEFLFPDSSQFVKGFIDLVFEWQGKIYFLDWKTNWLGPDASHYGEEKLREAMDQGDYWLQASLYQKALLSAWPGVEIGGAFYLFLRGIDADHRGVLFFEPRPLGALC